MSIRNEELRKLGFDTFKGTTEYRMTIALCQQHKILYRSEHIQKSSISLGMSKIMHSAWMHRRCLLLQQFCI